MLNIEEISIQRQMKNIEHMLHDKSFGKPKPQKRKKIKKPVKKVSSRGALIKKAHALLRDIVIKRDQYCVCPAPEKGHSQILQAGHLIPSTKGAVRFDLRNVHAQCSACNGRHVHYPHHYTESFIFDFGADTYFGLCFDAGGIGLKNYEIQEIIVQLEAIKARQVEDESFIPRFTQKEILSGSWRNK